MKKEFILIGGALLGALSLQAEQLTFITTMSAPVGVFSRVETQTSAVVTNTDLYEVGELRLNGGENRSVQLGNVTFGNQSQMASDAGKLQVAAVNVNKGGTLAGKHLIATNLQAQAETNLKVGDTLYSPTLNVDYARVDNLEINNGAYGKISRGTSAQTPQTLTWDTNTEGSGKLGEVLLKSPGNVQNPPPARHTYLSPLMGCVEKDISSGEHSSNDNLLPCRKVRESYTGWRAGPLPQNVLDNRYISVPESTFENQSAGPADCSPGKRYYTSSGQWYTIIAQDCYEPAYGYGPGSKRTIFRIAYATCVSAVTNPFDSYGSVVDCRTVSSGKLPVEQGFEDPALLIP